METNQPKRFVNGNGFGSSSHHHDNSTNRLPARRSGPVYCPPVQKHDSRCKQAKADEIDVEMSPVNSPAEHSPVGKHAIHPDEHKGVESKDAAMCLPTVLDSQTGNGGEHIDVAPERLSSHPACAKIMTDPQTYEDSGAIATTARNPH